MKYLESFRDVARAGYEAHIEHVKVILLIK